MIYFRHRDSLAELSAYNAGCWRRPCIWRGLKIGTWVLLAWRSGPTHPIERIAFEWRQRYRALTLAHHGRRRWRWVPA